MTIKSVRQIIAHIVETDSKEFPTHTRYGDESWTVRMGESDETVYECAELELAFQQFPKGQTELAALKAERDELRSYVEWLLTDLKIMHPEMLQSLGAKRLRSILERTEQK